MSACNPFRRAGLGVAAFLLAGSLPAITPAMPRVQAQTIPGTVCSAYIPSDWGTFKGVSDRYGLAFEDSAGVIRFVLQVPCPAVQPPVVTLEIHRK